MKTVMATECKQHFQKALDIFGLKNDEAMILASTEAERVLALIESLAGDDWDQPTDCTEWTVRQMVAHPAGSIAAQASWAETKRQSITNPYMKETAVKVNTMNRLQVEDRAEAAHAELVTEFREKHPKALRTRQRLPWLLRQLRFPFGPPLSFAPIGYLTDTIFTRDQWMHWLDIARATGKEMVITPEHDGRIVALAIYDLARKLKERLQEWTIDLLLSGDAGGRFRFGSGPQAKVTIKLDAFNFNRLASGRLSATAALTQATIEGNRAVVSRFLKQCGVPF